MKNNVTVSLLAFILVVSSLLGFAGITIREVKAQAPKILVGGPATATWSVHRGNRTGAVGSTVRYMVNITDVKELYSFEFTLAWGMNVLFLQSKQLRINGLPSPGSTYADGILNAPVYKAFESALLEANRTAIYRLAVTQIGSAPWDYAAGKGCVMYLDFKVQSPGGECDIYFVDSKLSFMNGSAISHSRQDGYFYLPGKNRVPTASFTTSPATKVANKTSVTFNGGGSSDPDGAGIKSYIWNFGQNKPTVPVIESPHPYPWNAKLNYTLKHPNAIRMRIYFPNITLETGDAIRIRDKNNVLIQSFTFSLGAPGVWSYWVYGDTININLTTDGDVGVGWGFSATHYNFFFQVATVTTTYTYTILQSDYGATPYGPYPFTTSLSVIDNEDSQSKTVTSGISVVHPRPIAKFTFSPNVTHYYPSVNWAYIFCGKTVTFDASGSYDPDSGGGIVWYAWDFGDGAKDNKSTPTTSYSFTKEGGEMYVGLRIKDVEGLENFWNYKLFVFNMTEFAITYGLEYGDPGGIFDFLYDIDQNLIVDAADLYIIGKSYY